MKNNALYTAVALLVFAVFWSLRLTGQTSVVAGLVVGSQSSTWLGGEPGFTWNSTEDIGAPDDLYASAVYVVAGVESSELVVRGLGLTLPPGAMVKGVQVGMERFATVTGGGGSVQDMDVRLLMADGATLSAANYGGAEWPAFDSDMYDYFGGPDDLWGETLSKADVEDPDFGVVFSAKTVISGGGGRTWSLFVDHVKITIYYQLGISRVMFRGDTLFVHPHDQGYYVPWHNGFDTIAGASSLTDGATNTAAIVTAQGQGAYAAYLCDTLDDLGFDDWYLPAKNQLDSIFSERYNIGGFGSYYWSSTELPGFELTHAMGVSFFDGTGSNSAKGDNSYSVRCVRSDVCSGFEVSAGPPQNICVGEQVSLSVTPAFSYSWAPSVSVDDETMREPLASPVATTTYMVTVTNEDGCTATSETVVVVKEAPTITITPDTAICKGKAIFIGATGGGSYKWSTYNISQYVQVIPAVTTLYSVTVTGANGCAAQADVRVMVNPLPPANAGNDVSVCAGAAATLVASGGTQYRWSNGVQTPSFTASAYTTATYKVTVTDINNCTATDQVVVTAMPLPMASAGADKVLCAGGSAQLEASGGTNYTWNSGATTQSVSIAPLATATYTVTVADSFNCSASDEVIVLVSSSMGIDAGADQFICPGGQAVLSATGASSFLWSNGQTAASVTVAPETTTQYKVSYLENGCSLSDSVTVAVGVLPMISAGSPKTICRGNTATLVATGAQSYLWNTGLDTSVILVAPDKNTTYMVTGWSGEGCSAKVSVSVQVSGGLANFLSNVLSNNQVRFTASVSGTADRYFWDFGDGAISNLQNPTHPYLHQGVYHVCLTAFEDATGCQSTACKDIVLGDGLMVVNYSFVANPLSNTVTFTNTSTGPVKDYYWRFDDGTGSNLANPVHRFTKAGVYNVCLTASDSLTATQRYQCREVVIGTDLLKSKFTFFINETDNRVSFLDASYGAVSRWQWDFGTEEFSEVQNPEYRFTMAGVYDVCLTVMDNQTARQSRSCKTVQIGQDALKADFTFMQDLATHKVHFSDASKGAPGHFYWTFGNGQSSNMKNPVMQYLQGGHQQVCLVVQSDVTKVQDQICKDIVIGTDHCFADFEYVREAATNTVYFTDNSLGGPAIWYWTLGDGKFRTDSAFSVSYAEEGYYEVCLQIETTSGCSSTKCKKIKIGYSACRAGFNYVVTDSLHRVQLSDASKGQGLKRFWVTAGDSTAIGRSPVYTYSAPGYYPVSLSVFEPATGCVDTRREIIKVGSPEQCRAAFDYYVDVAKKTIVLQNLSSGHIENTFWQLGHDDYSVAADPVVKWDEPGIYKITLTVGDGQGGCTNRMTRSIQIEDVVCDASFTAYVDSVNRQAYFKSRMAGEATQFYWEFGDGATSTKAKPAHLYAAPGYYQVTLNTYDSLSGCTDFSREVVLVSQAGGDCEAAFEYIPDWELNIVTFRNTSSVKNPGRVSWDFGDGGHSEKIHPKRLYKSTGYYAVCLTVEDTVRNCVNTQCENIRVGSATAGCLAQFSHVVDSVHMRVKFRDLSKGAPTNWNWNFGDGSGATDRHPEHRYGQPGFYHVSLKAENPGTTCMDYRNALINVSTAEKSLKCVFGFVEDTAFFGKGVLPIEFDGAAFGDPAEIEWDFGDGSTAAGTMSPTHDYQTPGVYQVCLTVKDAVTGQADTSCQVIDVGNTQSVSERMQGGWGLTAYPNPVGLHLVVGYTLSVHGKAQLTMYDVAGRVMMSFNGASDEGYHQQTIDMSTLGRGTYYLKVHLGNRVITKKIVKL